MGLSLYIATAALPFAVLGAFLFLRWNPIAFLAFHLITRFVLDSIPDVTYMPTVAGLSLMQMYSVAIVTYGMFFLWWRRRLWRSALGVEVLLIVFVYALGAALAGQWLSLVEGALKWLYLYVLINLMIFVLEINPLARVMQLLCLVGLYPLLNQFQSIITHAPVFSGGQYNYLGSFHHETVLSYLLLIPIPAAMYLLLERRGKSLGRALVFGGLLLYAHVAFYLANYRTLLLAVAVYWAAYLWYRYRSLSVGRRISLVFVTIFAVSVLGALRGGDVAEKFSELVTFVSDPGRYLDFSGRPTSVGLMNGRIDLINNYMSIYAQSPSLVKLVGIGIERGNELVGLYTHNEYVGALVETGVFGLLALLCFLARATYIALRAARTRRPEALVSAPVVLAIVAAALGTMPFRAVQAMAFLGLYLGVCEWCRRMAESASTEQVLSSAAVADHPGLFTDNKGVAAARPPRGVG